MAAKNRKFSFTRLMTNAFPNFANDAKGDVDMTPGQADLLFRYQVSLPSPRYLGPLAFFHAGITDSESISKKVQKNLIKYNIIAAPEGGEEQVSGVAPKDPGIVPIQGSGLMTVNTAAISKSLPSQVSFISVHAQRKLVGLLFVWEEECVRWKLLDTEESEVLAALEAERTAEVGKDGELEVRLRSVRMRMWLCPSERGDWDGGAGKGKGKELLPGYKEHSKGEAVLHAVDAALGALN